MKKRETTIATRKFTDVEATQAVNTGRRSYVLFFGLVLAALAAMFVFSVF